MQQKTTLTIVNEKGHRMTLVGTINDDGITFEYSVVDNTGEPMPGMNPQDDPFALFRCIDNHMTNLMEMANEATSQASLGGEVTH